MIDKHELDPNSKFAGVASGVFVPLCALGAALGYSLIVLGLYFLVTGHAPMVGMVLLSTMT